MRRPARLMRLAALALAPGLLAASAAAGPPDPADWPSVLAEARGQEVDWYAWGGEPRINAYIDWVAGEMKARHDITLRHVKVADTADVVARVLAEKTAGIAADGAVDLVWINGENFVAMKQHGLLLDAPWAERLPNFRLVGPGGSRASVRTDFGVPVEGREAPWGRAQLVFIHDSATLPEPPRTLDALLAWTEANPGRFTYPKPPDFLGTTFLKQVALVTLATPEILARPAGPDAAEAVQPVFDWLAKLHPHLWRSGRAFPANVAALRRLLADGETDIAMSFNPADADAAIASGELPATTRSYVLEGGTIGNTHYVAIPFNSGSAAAAMVVANFLLSPQAQARKADPAVWGDPTVLDVAALPPEDRALFEAIRYGPATLRPEELAPTLPEPHFSWTMVLEDAWERFALGR